MEAMMHQNRPNVAMILWAIAAVLIVDLHAAGKDGLSVSEISFERTICFGTCPSYRVTIKRDGTVEYEGRDFVAEKGLRTSKISSADFFKLENKIRAIHFFDLENEYLTQEVGGGSTAVTDLPSQIIVVKAGDGTKRIEDYFGGPKGLNELEELIDTVANTPVWTGHRADPQLSDIPYYDSFPLNRQLTFRGLIDEMGKKPDGKPRYMLCLVKNTLEFDLHMPPHLDLSQFVSYVVDATGTIKQGDGLFFEVSQMHRIRRYSNEAKKTELDAQNQSERR